MKLRTRALLFAVVTACAMASPASRPFAAAQGQPVAIKPDAQKRVEIRIDAQKRIGPMKPIWAWFGYDEPNYTYMKDGKKLLTELSKLSPVPVYGRVHNLLTTGDGTPALKWGSTNAYTEDATGKPIYDWTIVDRIVDTYLERKMKPLMQIGFMPEALSVKPQPYKHDWLTHQRVDRQIGNSYEAWKKMGSPQPPSSSQYAELEKVGQLQNLEAPKQVSVKDGVVTLTFALPRQGVSLVKLTW